jgi:anti-sigma-K factor RskA
MTPEHDDHDEMENLVAAFVLGACEPGEAEGARSHIEACAACRELTRRLSRSVAALPLATDEVRPPARLRESIMAAASASPPATARMAVPPRPRKVVSLPLRVRRSASFRFRISGYAVAVALLAVSLLGLAGWNVSLYRTLNQAPASYSFAGTGSMAGSRASVTSFSRDGITLLDFRGMPQPAEGKVYEVWLIGADARPVPAAVFTPDPGGGYQLVLTRGLGGVNTVAVTQEQGPDGARQPTQSPQLAGRIA